MKPVSIIELAAACGGRLVTPPGGDSGLMLNAVSTDTRTIAKGSLFVALRGDRFDGHDFAGKAIDQGADCLMLDAMPEGVTSLEVPVVLVENTLYGLQRLAHWYRRSLDLKVVGITGSNGKTSVKDFTASVVSQKFKVNATKGNLNNHIGLPLSVLSAEVDDQVCIWEMGMNHPGEIEPLCEIAAPDIGVITNIGTAHIEFMGSRDGIAEEKSALARSLTEHGTLIVTASCDYVDYLIERTHAKVIVTGNCRGTVRAERLVITDAGSTFDLCIDGQDPVAVSISVSGKHMVNNALLAASVGYALGITAVEIAEGLYQTILTSGRLRQFRSHGVAVIDDTYNANPDSVVAAIETLVDLPMTENGRKIIVLGLMAELGVHADAEHLRVGQLAAEKGLLVVSVGDGARKIFQGSNAVDTHSQQFDDRETAAAWLKDYCREGDRVLFKGSRLVGMEQVMKLAFPTTTFEQD